MCYENESFKVQQILTQLCVVTSTKLTHYRMRYPETMNINKLWCICAQGNDY